MPSFPNFGLEFPDNSTALMTQRRLSLVWSFDKVPTGAGDLWPNLFFSFSSPAVTYVPDFKASFNGGDL